MLNIIIFGPPGAGKGTQSERIIERYRLTHLSTGDILRNEIKNETKLGILAKSYMDKGALVPDAVVIDMLKNKIEENRFSKGFVFDGFPRTLAQAKSLDEMLNKAEIPISIVVSLDVKDDELINRLVKRGAESGRSDDNEEVIVQRLNVYKQQTMPLIDYYKNQGKLGSVHGVGSIDEIFKKICNVIDKDF